MEDNEKLKNKVIFIDMIDGFQEEVKDDETSEVKKDDDSLESILNRYPRHCNSYKVYHEILDAMKVVLDGYTYTDEAMNLTMKKEGKL